MFINSMPLRIITQYRHRETLAKLIIVNETNSVEREELIHTIL